MSGWTIIPSVVLNKISLPMNRLILLSLISLSFACSAPKEQSVAVDQPYTLATPKSEWVASRVGEAKSRLSQTAAGQMVWKAMEFHGGLAKWWGNGPVYYRFNYQPRNNTGVPRDTYETADYWSSKTRHQRVVDPSTEYGWDGQNAWYKPDTAAIPYNTRFWALTPYYFAGMPFVFADQGVVLTKEEDAIYEDVAYDIVRVTFEGDVGDAPDDYYVLYLDKESSRLVAIRYVVSYPGYFKDGGHSQEKLMTYEGQQQVNGISFPEKHRTFMWEADGSIGAYVTDITLSDIEFRPATEQSFFETPTGSYVYNGLVE